MLTRENEILYFGNGPYYGFIYKITCNHDSSLLYVGQTTNPPRRQQEHLSSGMLGHDRTFHIIHRIESESMVTVLTALDAMEARIVAGEEPPLNMRPGGGQMKRTIKSAKRSYDAYLRVYDDLVEFKRVHGHLIVPQKHAELGKIVNDMRSKKKYVNGILWRREQLNDIGFVWDAHENSWLEFLLIENSFPTFNVPQKHPGFGALVNCIRKQGTYINHNISRGEYLYNSGFKLHAKNATINDQRWAEYLNSGTLDFWP